MIASFFRHLETQGVEWLLISGQATILYGAATFQKTSISGSIRRSRILSGFEQHFS